MWAAMLSPSLIFMVKNCRKRNRRLAAFLCSYRVSKDSQASAEVLALLTLRSCKSFMCKQIHDNALSSRSSHFSISSGVTPDPEGFFSLPETIFQRPLSIRMNLILSFQMCQFSPSNFSIMRYSVVMF